MKKMIYRYSEAFKQEVVSKLEEGRFGSPSEASQAYGIDRKTVRSWVKAYGKSHLLSKVVRVEKPGEPGEIKRMKERVRQLESTVADLVMDKALAESFFSILCDRTDTDAGAFKKKHAGTASTRRGRVPKSSQV